MEIYKEENKKRDLIDEMEDILSQACKILNDLIIQESTRHIERPRYDFKHSYRLKGNRMIEREKVKELKKMYADVTKLKIKVMNDV